VGTKKIWAVPGWAFVRMDPVNVLAKFEVRSFNHSWDNSDCSFGRLRIPNIGEEEAVGVGSALYHSKEHW